MKTIAWAEAVSILSEWASRKTDIRFSKTAGIHPERNAFEAASGDWNRIVSVSPDNGGIDLEVHGRKIPVDLRGSTIKRSEGQPHTLEFTFPEGEVWIFSEA